MNLYILQDRLSELVQQIISLDAEDKLYQFFLHKVYDKSYMEFKQGLESDNFENQSMSKDEFADILMQSENILSGFIPDGGE